MFTQTLYEAIIRFQSYFPREVVYEEKAVTIYLDFLCVQFSNKFGKNSESLIWLYHNQTYHNHNLLNRKKKKEKHLK